MENKFQVNFEVIRLYDENNPPPMVTKVGILPFLPASHSEAWRFMVMKPRAEAKHLNAPLFQLAKGTRRIYINECWCDMREDDLRHADESFWEPLMDTALREGEEEIGLKPGNIKSLFDMGGFVFVSASRGIKKPLHMFAAKMNSEDDFAPFESTTLEARWMTREEFAEVGRPDHVVVLNAIAKRLAEAT